MSKSTVLPNFRSGIFVSMVAGLFAVTGIPLAVAQDGADDEVEEIVVTGSYIKRSQSEMASPIQIIDSETMADIGASSLPDLVNSLTINSGAQIYANNLEQGRNAGTTNINLRGLGEASTLVLLNGTRSTLTPAVNLNGDQYVNLSTLVPMIAIGRVEILKDGASALYGSDAVAGVVNFITRDQFEGLEFKIESSNNEFGGDEFNFGLILGGKHDRGNIMAAFQYMTVDPVINAERQADFRPTQNSITAFGNPSNIISFGEGVVMPDPMCDAAGATLPPGQVFEAFLCRMTFGYWGNVVSEEERFQGYVSGSYEIAPNAEFFGELTYANNEVIIGSVPTQPNTNPVYAPENHPDVAIFGQCAPPPAVCDPFAGVNRINADGNREVQWWGRIFGGGQPQNNDLKPFDLWRTKGGLRGEINDTWDYTLSFAYSAEETSATRVESIQNELQEALYGRGGPNRNEFYRFAWETQDLNSQEMYDSLIGIYGYDAEATQKVFDAIVSGELGSMGGGPIGVAFGVQWREDSLEYDYNDQSNKFVFSFFVGGDDFFIDQQSTAVFAEVALPISDTFELNLAARWEEIDTSLSSSSESTVDPKVSFLFTPTDEWSIRGSWGTSFRVPSLFTQAGSFFDANAGQDPIAGIEITFLGEATSDPSTPVVPQEATTYNLGVTYTGANGLTASLDYWNFDYDGYIAYESRNAILVTDPLGPQVIRDANLNVLKVIGFARNAGFLQTDGIDFNISYAIDAGGAGTITPFLESTFMLGYDVDDPTWGPLDALGWGNQFNIGAPAIETRANLGVQWDSGPHAANLIARYIDSYVSDESSNRLGGPITTTDSSGNAVLDVANFIPVDSMTTIDAQYAYHFDGMFGGDTEGTIRLGVRNAGDERSPPYFNSSGYDHRVHDPRGRYFYGSVTVTF